jgi:hypothetical protein
MSPLANYRPGGAVYGPLHRVGRCHSRGSSAVIERQESSPRSRDQVDVLKGDLETKCAIKYAGHISDVLKFAYLGAPTGADGTLGVAWH